MAERICRSCRDIRDRDIKELRRMAAEAGKKICSKCKVAKPMDAYNAGDRYRKSTCKVCRASASRLIRQDAAVRKHDPSKGSPETGFTCTICDVFRPPEFFRISPSGYWDYRCKECLAKKSRAYRNSPEGKFVAACGIANRRDIEWSLTADEYRVLRLLPCHYCGHALPESGVGLDRIDCNLGYTLSNVVPCCTECNLAKGCLFTHDEMLVIGKAIGAVKTAWGGNRTAHRGWGRPLKYQDVS